MTTTSTPARIRCLIDDTDHKCVDFANSGIKVIDSRVLHNWWAAHNAVLEPRTLFCSAIQYPLKTDENGYLLGQCTNMAKHGTLVTLSKDKGEDSKENKKFYVVPMCDGHHNAKANTYYLKSYIRVVSCPCHATDSFHNLWESNFSKYPDLQQDNAHDQACCLIM